MSYIIMFVECYKQRIISTLSLSYNLNSLAISMSKTSNNTIHIVFKFETDLHIYVPSKHVIH